MHSTVVTEDPARFTQVREEYRPLAAMLSSDTGLDPTEGNSLSMLPDAQEYFDLLTSELRGAKKSIYLDFYRIRMDSLGRAVADILKEQAACGLDVRIVVDNIEAKKGDREVFAEIRQAGGIAEIYPSILTALRDHRKIAIVDDRTAYTGGRNIQQKYLQWQDCNIRLQGPCVADLGQAYNEDQRRAAPALEPVSFEPAAPRIQSDSPEGSALQGLKIYSGKTVQIVPDTAGDRKLPIRNLYEWSIGNSGRYFYLSNPYAPPPASIARAMEDAARRGVDVRWIVPAINDEPVEKWIDEAMYPEYLKAGVRIFEWQEGRFHTKQFVTDDYLTVIGSANMDNLSLFMNSEVMVAVYDSQLATDMRDAFLSDCEVKCREVTLDEVRRWSVFRRLWNWFARVMAGPWL